MIAVCLVAAGFLVAWLRFRPHLGTEGAFTDGERTIEIERVDELRYAVWDAPLPLPGELNSEEPEGAPVLSPDGRYMLFVAGARGIGTDIWICDLDSQGNALEPRPLIGVNSAADELAPSFSTDGALLFASNRPGGEGGLDLWRSQYDRGVFGRPEHLDGRGLNTPADETDPTSVPGSDEIFFASNRLTPEQKAAKAARQFDIYSAQPLPILGGAEVVWEVQAIAEVNSPYDERDPSLTIDGRAMLFASDRGATGHSIFGLGGAATSRELPLGARRPAGSLTDTDFDLFRTARTPKDHPDPEFTAEWLPPRALEGVNTDASERHPQPTTDGFALLFARGTEFSIDDSGKRTAIRDSEVDWDVWRATSREVVRTPGKPVGWREIIVLLGLLLLALLAALAKRWRGMDVIYKAFLVSLLLHLALLAWSRDVIPEGGEVELRKADENRVRVRLVEDPNSLRAQMNEERGGRVEAARSEAVDESELARAEMAETSALDEAAAPTAMGALSRAEAELAAGPTRAETSTPVREVNAERVLQEDVRESREAFERKTGEAAPLSVAAAQVESNRKERTAAEVARDSALASADPAAAVASTEAPSLAPMERSRSRTQSSQVEPARQRVDVDRSQEVAAADAERAPAITGPAQEFDRKVADSRTSSDSLSGSASESPSLDQRSAADTPTLQVEVPSTAPVSGDSLVIAPSSGAELKRATRSEFVGGPVALPTAAPALADPGDLQRSVEVALEGPSGDALSERSSGPAAPAFDPLAGADSAAEPFDRTSQRTGSTSAPERAQSGTSATSELASAGDLAPTTLTPLGRGRSKSIEPPSFAVPGRAAPDTDLERQAGPSSSREISVADVKGDLGSKPSPADAAAGTGHILADLGPTGSGPLTRRGRGDSGPSGPGRAAVAQGPIGFKSSGPAAVEIGVPDAPRPVAVVPKSDVDSAQWDRTPYQSRTGERKIAALEEFGGGAETERAVDGGLGYLARRQRSDGRWGRKEIDDKYGQPMVGKTGLACLAFMGAGHTPSSSTKYSTNVAKGLEFLRLSQDPDSGHFGNTSSYGHAIATYALGEAFALTKDPELRVPLIRAVQQIINQQVSSRDPLLDGGWSYFFADGHTVDRWPRASVTAWQVMALESAKLGGLNVPGSAFSRARTFLVNSWDPSRSAFRYSHDPSRLGSDYPVLPGSTPASMFALSLLGADIGAQQFAPARNFILARAPEGYRFSGDDDFVYKAQGNLYFWYYGTLALFRAGGDSWRRWNLGMKDTLLPAQEQDGSWRPISIYAGYAQDSDGDRSYTTAMNVLTLEVYYRYFTPLLKVE